MSIREQILQKLETLATGMVVDDRAVEVYRSRTQALARGESPAVVLRPASEDVSTLPGSVSERWLAVRFEVIERSEVPDQGADPLLVELHKRVMADTRLGGLAITIEEVGSEWDDEEADGGAGLIELKYRIQYRTKMKDLSSQ